MKPIVIAGNGPSLTQIDYSRLPQDFDVFRCNQFYFEDRYFLGKKIKGVFFNYGLFREQFFTLHCLKERGEYDVEDVYCNMEYGERHFVGKKSFETFFPTVKKTYAYLRKMPKFCELELFNRLYYHLAPTSGIVMLYTAIAQGYKEIYLTGIDFYKGGGIDYAFAIKSDSNLSQKIPDFQNKNHKSKWHTLDLDIQFIKLALLEPGIKIYAISPNSAICEFLPIAPLQNKDIFEVNSKPLGYICDLIEPPFFCSPFKQKLKEYGVKKDNICIRTILDFLQLCRGIVYAIKKWKK